VAVKKLAVDALSALERERCEELINEFESQVGLHRQSRLELGKIAHELKPLYVRSGRKGGWTKFLGKHKLNIRTVDGWILDYERSAGLRQPPENKGRMVNVAKSATFQNATPQVLSSNNPDTNGREAVSAVFVLTAEEKDLFIAAVKRLTPAEATRRIYEAVITEPGTVQGA
jgi:hypothetical protein